MLQKKSSTQPVKEYAFTATKNSEEVVDTFAESADPA
jgi:hypothetical protein